MNKQRRFEIKEAVVRTLQSYNKPLELPIPIKAVTKHLHNVKLIKYSTQMRRRNLSYEEMLIIADSEDACTVYDGEVDAYTVYYNDLGANQMSSYRYRWNIAHELGHIVLEHHKKHKESKLFRSSLSKELYKILEDEADTFAAYILVPHILLHCAGIQNDHEIADFCHISGAASKVRRQHYENWKRRNRCESYDLAILNCYSDFVESLNLSKRVQSLLNRHRRCRHCGSLIALSHSFCRICGAPSHTQYVLEVNPMKYSGIELDEKSRALSCPVCGNTDLAEDGTFCMICGTEIVNRCDRSVGTPFSECSHVAPLPGNARYCPHCGGISTFYKNDFLVPWQRITPKSTNASAQPIYEDNDDLPF